MDIMALSREEAIQDIIDYRMWWYEIDEHVITTNDAIDTIHQIYDDIESRTCEGCKHSSQVQTGETFMVNGGVKENIAYHYSSFCKEFDNTFPSTFGCILFERQENENN